MKSKIASLITLVTIALFVACSPKVVPVVSEPAPPPAKPLTPEMAEAKTLYENNCANCHRLFDRREYNAEEWKPIVLRMQSKAKITDLERDKIYSYLTMN